jgi:diguanylate cyclase (GGDEF)-like protein
MQDASMTILLAEDQQGSQSGLSQALRQLGHRVLEASTSREALTLFQSQRPDLVLVDVGLPGGEDGYWLARQVRDAEGSRWTPIIFVSGQEHELSLWEGIEAGGDDYLIKPISPVVLRAKLHAMRRLLHMRNQLIAATEELRAANERLSHLSFHDDLTGLGNRRSFNERLHTQLGQCRREHKPLTLILCDVDHFKRFNDSIGHVEGDQCLQNIARLMRLVCRRPTDFVARYGGEEFGIILPNTPKAGAMTFARALQSLVRTRGLPHPDSPVSEHVTLSGGITTVVPDDDTTVQSLIMRADEALYAAKVQGRNRFFSFEMQLDTNEHLQQGLWAVNSGLGRLTEA